MELELNFHAPNLSLLLSLPNYALNMTQNKKSFVKLYQKIADFIVFKQAHTFNKKKKQSLAKIKY